MLYDGSLLPAAAANWLVFNPLVVPVESVRGALSGAPRRGPYRGPIRSPIQMGPHRYANFDGGARDGPPVVALWVDGPDRGEQTLCKRFLGRSSLHGLTVRLVPRNAAFPVPPVGISTTAAEPSVGPGIAHGRTVGTRSWSNRQDYTGHSVR